MKLSQRQISALSVGIAVVAIAAALVLIVICFAGSGAEYNDIIDEFAEEFCIDKDLIKALIHAESGFDPDAVSPKGAVGLMQIMPSTAEFLAKRLDIGEYDLFDPRTNIYFGTAYLKYLYGRFSSDKTVIAAYNAGEGRVAEWLKNPDYSSDGVDLKVVPFKETAVYIKRVVRYKKFLHGCGPLFN